MLIYNSDTTIVLLLCLFISAMGSLVSKVFKALLTFLRKKYFVTEILMSHPTNFKQSCNCSSQGTNDPHSLRRNRINNIPCNSTMLSNGYSFSRTMPISWLKLWHYLFKLYSKQIVKSYSFAKSLIYSSMALLGFFYLWEPRFESPLSIYCNNWIFKKKLFFDSVQTLAASQYKWMQPSWKK